MKKHLTIMTALLSSALMASAFAATIDATKQTISNDFIEHVQEIKAKYDEGGLILAPFAKAEQITEESLSQFLPFELDMLEESFFPNDTKWYDDDHNDFHGKISTENLSEQDKKAVELIRAEKQKVEKNLGVAVKSGDSIDLNGDGTKEKITIATDDKDFLTYITIGSSKVSIYVGKMDKAYAINVDDTKLLLIMTSGYSDYTFTTAIKYDGKKANKISSGALGGNTHTRYAGDGIFYSLSINVPVTKVDIFQYEQGQLIKTGEREQKPLQSIKIKAKDDYNTEDFSLKCKGLNGKTVTFKANEKIAVLTCFPWKAGIDEDSPNEEASIALINEKGQVGLITTAENGYGLAGVKVVNDSYGTKTAWFIHFSDGFYYIP